MEQINITSNEAILYASIAHAAIGFLLGLIPLVLGFLRKERSYGVFGFLGSCIGGAILGLFLSLPVAAIFTWLILRRPRNQTIETAANEAPTATAIENSERL